MSVRVVKIGGAALADASWRASFATHAAASAGPVVVVHGGGPEISALSERLGIGVEWVNGKRITPPAALDVASMVLNGRVNKRLVSALLTAGVDAFGFSGVDGGLITASLVAGGGLGQVGRVASVRAELLEWVIDRGMTPVIAPLSRAADGALLNVNADEVAAAIAIAVGAHELLFVTDVDGVRDDSGAACGTLSIARAEALLAAAVATGGMAVKLRAAIDAVGRGVARVRIGDVRALDDDSGGTVLSSSPVEVTA